jgi:hypothetical protein
MAGEIVPQEDLPESSSQQGLVPAEDLPDNLVAQSGAPVPQEDLPESNSDDVRQFGAAAEGAAQGLIGPLAPMAEIGLSKLGVPGLSAEDQRKRAEDFPATHAAAEAATFAGSMLLGVGEARIAALAAEKAAAKMALGKIGSGAIKGMIEGGIFQSGDEMTKGLLGQGDPEAPAASALAHIGGAMLLGGAGGGAFSAAGEAMNAASKLKAVEDAKLGTKFQDFLAGVGAAAQGPNQLPVPQDLSPMFKKGMETYQKIPAALAKTATAGITGITTGLPLGTDIVIGNILGPKIEGLVDRTLSPSIKKIAIPVVMKALSEGDSRGLYEALDNIQAISRGAQKMTNSVGNVFNSTVRQAFDYDITDKEREKIKKYLDAGGLDQQLENQQAQPSPGFAKGGVVAPIGQDPQTGLANQLPQQAMMMMAAKGRVANYLNGSRPQKNAPKLPYDRDHDQRAQEKKFNKALDIAISPLSILNKVKSGNLGPEELKDFHAMYPEIYNQLAKGLTGEITKQQLKKETIPYRTRQGLSLFLGAPLDSSFQPQNIQAAQSVFAQKQQAEQQAASSSKKPKKDTSKLSDAKKQFQTSEQATQERQVAER